MSSERDADCLAIVLSTPVAKERDGSEIPASALAPVAVLAGAVRALAAKVGERADGDGIRLSDVVRYRAEPGDVVVAYVPGDASPMALDQIRRTLAGVFKGPVVVMSCGIGIEVVKPSAVPAGAS